MHFHSYLLRYSMYINYLLRTKTLRVYIITLEYIDSTLYIYLSRKHLNSYLLKVLSVLDYLFAKDQHFILVAPD